MSRNSTTRTESVVSFPLQQRLDERATMLRRTFIAYLALHWHFTVVQYEVIQFIKI